MVDGFPQPEQMISCRSPFDDVNDADGRGSCATLAARGSRAGLAAAGWAGRAGWPCRLGKALVRSRGALVLASWETGALVQVGRMRGAVKIGRLAAAISSR